MKIFFVIHKYDEGAYITEDETECDVPFASYDSALRALAKLDEVDYAKHLKYEEQRMERWRNQQDARAILESHGFPATDNVLYLKRETFETRDFESNYVILQLEVME